MEVGLGPSDFVLDGDPTNKGVETRNFRPMSIVAKQLDGSRWHLAWRWASVQATLYGTQLPSPIGDRAPPNFRPICIVTKRLDASRCHLAWR